MSGLLAKLVGGAVAAGLLGLGVWYFVHVLETRATCYATVSSFKATEAAAAASARSAQKKADAADLKGARLQLAQTRQQLADARSVASGLQDTVNRLRGSLAAAERASASAMAQGTACLDPAIRAAEGFAPVCK